MSFLSKPMCVCTHRASIVSMSLFWKNLDSVHARLQLLLYVNDLFISMVCVRFGKKLGNRSIVTTATYSRVCSGSVRVELVAVDSDRARQGLSLLCRRGRSLGPGQRSVWSGTK